MLEKFTVGERVDSYCMKCKMSVEHTIYVMDGEEIVKVKCKSCSSMHKFRDPQNLKKPGIVKKKEDTTKTTEMLWEMCVAEARGKECSYDMAGKYCVGDIVFHAVFGKGVVRKVYYNKCDILFKDKERLMASVS